jgi:hypothetical protein
VIIFFYILATFFGFFAGYYLKKHVAGSTLLKDIVCMVFNSFFGILHLGVCKYEDLLFFGDISSLTVQYPLILWLGLIGMFVQVLFMPFNTYRSTYR